MHSAIVYAVMPPSAHETREMISRLYAAIPKLEKNPAVAVLGEFVWQIDFQSSPAALAARVGGLEQLALPYGILQLDAAPQWIGRDPKTKA